MPYDPSQPKGKGGNTAFSYFEVMGDITYLSRKMNISPNEIWKLPHSHYLAYMKHNTIFDLQQTEEGREILKKFERFINPRTKPDLQAIRSFGGYKKAGEN